MRTQKELEAVLAQITAAEANEKRIINELPVKQKVKFERLHDINLTYAQLRAPILLEMAHCVGSDTTKQKKKLYELRNAVEQMIKSQGLQPISVVFGLEEGGKKAMVTAYIDMQ